MNWIREHKNRVAFIIAIIFLVAIIVFSILNPGKIPFIGRIAQSATTTAERPLAAAGSEVESFFYGLTHFRDIQRENYKLKNDLNNELERIKILKMIDACTKKAINHDVLIEEFKEMQNKYFDELENVFNEIFKINFYQIVIFDDSFLGKFKRNFVAIFLGRRKFERFLKEYNNFMLKDFEEKNDKKIKKLKKEINKVTELIEIKKQEVQNEYYRMIA